MMNLAGQVTGFLEVDGGLSCEEKANINPSSSFNPAFTLEEKQRFGAPNLFISIITPLKMDTKNSRSTFHRLFTRHKLELYFFNAL